MKQKNVPVRWSNLSYAGETRVPLGIEPNAWAWPTFYLKRDSSGNFLYPNGKKINFDIAVPDNIDFDKELDMVKYTLCHLTKEQIDIAKYYGEGPPTKQWTPVIDRLIDTYEQPNSPQENPVKAARILACVQAGINDAMIVTWFYKYLWDIPRPNQLDQELKTILCTPKFPSYPSGHAAMSGCAEQILSYFFPTEKRKLRKIAEEDAFSRVYAGVHFPVDCEEGLHLGRQIGKIVVSILRRQQDNQQSSVDHIMTRHLDADIIPRNYKRQALPFPRMGKCDSMTVSTV